MRALITGSNGQVGRELCRRKPVSAEIECLDSTALDIVDPSAVDAAVEALRPNVIFNAAAYTAVDNAESDETRAFAVNSIGPANLLHAAERNGAKLVHISTDFVFDGLSSTPYRPNDRVNPRTAYGRSKLAGERALGENALIVRTSWVYAAHGRNFVLTMLRLMAERDEIGVVSDQFGSPTWAGGLARALWALASENQSGIMHYSDGGAISWYDFAVAIREEALAIGLLNKAAIVRPIGTVDYPTPAQRPAYSVLDTRSTNAALGWTPVPWRSNLRQMLEECEV